MKKLFLAALLGLISLAASANNVIGVNNKLQCNALITVQFVEHDFGTCAINGYSPVYTVTPGATWNLDDPMVWNPTTLYSYQMYGVIICITCPNQPTVCLPEIFTMPGCGPVQVPPTPINCCGGTISADITAGGGGGVCFTLDIQP